MVVDAAKLLVDSVGVWVVGQIIDYLLLFLRTSLVV